MALVIPNEYIYPLFTFFTKYYKGHQTKMFEMGKECATHEKHKQNFRRITWQEVTTEM
jgi:hypothetical protein